MWWLNWDGVRLLNTQIKTITGKLLQYIHGGTQAVAITHSGDGEKSSQRVTASPSFTHHSFQLGCADIF